MSALCRMQYETRDRTSKKLQQEKSRVATLDRFKLGASAIDPIENECRAVAG